MRKGQWGRDFKEEEIEHCVVHHIKEETYNVEGSLNGESGRRTGQITE